VYPRRLAALDHVDHVEHAFLEVKNSQKP
jgi:hypothetical protein